MLAKGLHEMSRGRRGSNKSRKGPTRSHHGNQPSGILSITRRGHGFVETPEGEFFISARHLNGAMHGDRVVVSPDRNGRGSHRSARITHVIDRAHDTVIGAYERNDGLGVIVPYDPRIGFDLFCEAASCPEARDGDVVRAHIVTYPSRHTSAVAQVVQVIGRADDDDIAEKVLIDRNGIETEFSAAALDEAASCTLDVEAALAEPDRRDLRDVLTFTIDPVDARDFDDAVSVERRPDGGWHLGVHIADVSSYAPFGSSIDLDARRRATSTYLPDRVIPMLPEALCDDLCSLRPDCDRLAFTVDLGIDAGGQVVSSGFHPSVIRSDARLDYGQVQSFYDREMPYPTSELGEALEALRELASCLRARRVADGAIDFESTEPKVVLSETGEVTEVYLKSRTEATGVIEEAMICANEAVARFMSSRGMPMVYRVHDVPSLEAISSLKPLLLELGYPVDDLLSLDSGALQVVLARAEHRPERYLVESRVLRSMKRAVYSPENIGHYGLASDCYCHFTSPIRRYPDLMVHRLLRAVLLGALDGRKASGSTGNPRAVTPSPAALEGLDRMVEQLDSLCRHASEREQAAAEVEREATLIKVLGYLERFVGEMFDGVIASVSSSGLQVMLPVMVKGFVPMGMLGDEHFICDFERQVLTGEDSGKVYRVGMQVRCQLKSVSFRELSCELSLV